MEENTTVIDLPSLREQLKGLMTCINIRKKYLNLYWNANKENYFCTYGPAVAYLRDDFIFVFEKASDPAMNLAQPMNFEILDNISLKQQAFWKQFIQWLRLLKGWQLEIARQLANAELERVKKLRESINMSHQSGLTAVDEGPLNPHQESFFEEVYENDENMDVNYNAPDHSADR